MKSLGKIVALTMVFGFALLGGPALAGDAGEVYCTTPGCGYKHNLQIGGGKQSPAITGYCRSSKEFVRLKLNNWNEYRNPHYCPGTREPMLPIYDGSQVAKIPCPKCGYQTLQYKRRLFFD
jgi:hypothetical protein